MTKGKEALHQEYLDQAREKVIEGRKLLNRALESTDKGVQLQRTRLVVGRINSLLDDVDELRKRNVQTPPTRQG